MFGSMSLSRRQFFGHFWGSERLQRQRLARYEVIKGWVRTYLYPYDFTVTAEQNAELFAEVQSALEQTPNDVLFSDVIRLRIEELAEEKFQLWRAQLLQRTNEIRHSAVEHVSTFLSSEENAPVAEQLRQRLGIDDLETLEKELKKRVQDWIVVIEDGQLIQHDMKSLVFAQLQSWC